MRLCASNSSNVLLLFENEMRNIMYRFFASKLLNLYKTCGFRTFKTILCQAIKRVDDTKVSTWWVRMASHLCNFIIR